ncbi:hypothetical protein D9M68_477830 [compost metagenome]
MQLAVALEVADVLVELLELGVQVAALPQQGADHQQQREEQPGPVHQAFAQLAHARPPGHFGQLAFQQARGGFQPVVVQRLVAGYPEHLLVEGRAQGLRGFLQLFLVELQGDGFVQQGVQFTAQAIEQFAAGADQVHQGRAQFRGHLLRRLLGQQAVDIALGVAQLVALLVQLELVEADVGDFVGQVVVQVQLGQRLLLLVEDLGQQQAALEHADLLFQGLVGLAEVVQLLAGLQALPGQLVEAVGGAQQVVGHFQVDGAFLRQQAVRRGLAGFAGELRDGLLRAFPAHLVDQRLQVQGFLLQAANALHQQVAAGIAEVLQQAVAGQLLAAQFGLGGERGLFGVKQGALLFADGLAGVLAGLEDVVDLLAARLVAADLGLGPLRAGLRRDDQAVGVGQGLLQVGQLIAALLQQLLQLGQLGLAIALLDRRWLYALEPRQLVLGLSDQLRCIVQLAFEVGELLLAFLLAGEEGPGLLLDGWLGRGFALGGLVGGGRRGRLGGTDRRRGMQVGGRQAEAKQGGNEKGTQGSNHRDRAARGSNAANDMPGRRLRGCPARAVVISVRARANPGFHGGGLQFPG